MIRPYKLYNLLILLTIITLSAIPLMAQSGQTTVSGTIADGNGTLYINSPYTVTFYDPGTSGKLPLLNGSTFQKSYSGLATNSSGVLSISLPDNNVIASTSGATGTQWTFSICTAAASYTTIFCIPPVTITITGATQNISSAITAVAPILPVSLGNPYTANGHYTGDNTTCIEDKQYVAGSSCYTTIQAAITAAGTTGSVKIRPDYIGTDAYTNPNGISVDDRRVTNGLFENRTFSVIAPSFPVTDYPGGHDLVLRTRGSADSYREHLVTKTTTATALNVGANNNILVAAVTVGNLTRGTLQTGDTSLLGNSSILGLSIGRDTANAEVVLGGSWSVVDATHLNITCAKSHASIVDIDLGAGDLLLAFGTLIIDSAVVKATQTSTYNPPLVIQDSTGITIGKWPTNRGDIWPHSAWQFSAPITGGFSGGVDLYIRALTAAAKLQYWDFAGAEKLWDVSNDGIWLINGNGSARPIIQVNHDSAAGNGAQFFMQYNGATSLLISAQADTPHIYGGGTSSGISFYGSNGGAGTSGIIRFRNNGTDETQKASIDTGTGLAALTTLSVGGGTTINLYKTVTDTPGAITVNNLTCTDRAVALAGSGTGAIIGIAAAYALDANIFVSPAQAVAGTLHYRICNVSGGNITLNAAAAFNLMVLQ